LRVLVTGANGFLGRHVVAALSDRGHSVRALVRPSAELGDSNWSETVEVVRSDLRTDPNLSDHLVGVDAVIHLAAAMSGSDFSRFQETVTSTERLFGAMQRAEVDRLLLCSSFSTWGLYSGEVVAGAHGSPRRGRVRLEVDDHPARLHLGTW
jgi:UDP-glucose 4-epimerase